MFVAAAHKMSIKAPLKPSQLAIGKQLAQEGDRWHMLSTGRGDQAHFVDGGVVANNPTIAGLSFLQRIFPDSNATNTAVLSLGCGSCWSSSGLPIAKGKAFVASALIDIMLGANCDTAVAAGEMLYRTVSCTGASRSSLRFNSSRGRPTVPAALP